MAAASVLDWFPATSVRATLRVADPPTTAIQRKLVIVPDVVPLRVTESDGTPSVTLCVGPPPERTKSR